MPVFVRDVGPLDPLRMITTQFWVNGKAKQVDMVRAFGVIKIRVKRAMKRYREQGEDGRGVAPR
jgi:hypothetical protein